MGFAFYDHKVVTITVADLAGDKKIHLYRAPEYMTLVSAYATVTTAMGTSKGAALTVLNYGTAGTAVGGTVTDSLGGSAAGNDFETANVPVAFTIADGAVEAGEWLVLDVDEEGDWQGGMATLHLEFRPGH